MSTLRRVIEAAVFSSDPYVRSWISLLLMRDWRTHVLAEINDLDVLQQLCEDPIQSVDVVIFDLDNLGDPLNIDSLMAFLKRDAMKAKCIFLCGDANKKYLPLLDNQNAAGILIKHEIDFSIAWAVCTVVKDQRVISPSIKRAILFNRHEIPNSCLVLENPLNQLGFTKSEARIARLAFIFSMARSNIADELSIGLESTWTLISRLYDVLGVTDLLNGDDWSCFCDEEDEILSNHLEIMLSNKKLAACKGAKETLAFHMLTKPRIELFDE